MTVTVGSINLIAFGYAVSVVVSILIVFFTVKIPVKKRYHYGFMMFVLLAALYLTAAMFDQLTDSVEVYAMRIWWEYALGPPVQLPVLTYFVILFVNPIRGRRWRYLVAAACGYAALWLGIVLLNPSLLYVQPRETSTGFVTSAGDLILPMLTLGLVLLLAVFFLIVGQYRARSSAFVKGQLRYFVGGVILYTLGPISYIGFQYFGGPPVQSYFISAGMTTMLVGLGTQGFFSIKPTAETPSSAPLDYELPGGTSYLVLDQNPSKAFRIFSDLITHGWLGLCITRSPPESVRHAYQLRNTPIRWLAEINRDEVLAPEDLMGLSLTIQDFIQNAARPAVILHGLEYLVSINEFHPVLRLVNRLNDVIVEKGGVLLLPLVPRSLEERDEALLTAECSTLPANVRAQ